MGVFILAEIGVNHNGDFQEAIDLALAAKESGADAAKFQLFRDRPEIEHLRITEEEMWELSDYCTSIGLEFMCTPFYLEAVDFLDPLVKRHKIASGWMKSRDIFDAAVATGKQVIASLGMATDQDLWDIPWNVSLLHCVSLYPCPDEKANLRMARHHAGYSDHTLGTLACVGAAAMGAQIIEKHFTFDKTQEGPDHSCSAEPHEFAQMVKDIRRLEKML